MKQAETWATLAALLKVERDKALSAQAHRSHASAVILLGALASVASSMADAEYKERAVQEDKDRRKLHEDAGG